MAQAVVILRYISCSQGRDIIPALISDSATAIVKEVVMMFSKAIMLILLTLMVNRSCAQSFSMSFPFEVDSLNGYILIQLSIAETEPRWFILDTGSNSGTALSWDTAKQLSLPYDEDKKLNILFGLSKSEVGAYLLDTSISIRLLTRAERMDDFSFGLMRQLLVLPKEIELPICIVNKRFVRAAGILSLAAFGNMIVRICYDTRTLTVSNTLEREGWISVSNTKHDENKLYIRLTIGDHTIDAFLDSGVPAELALNRELRERFRELLHLTLGNPYPSFTAYDALSFPEVTIGASSIRLFRVMVHEYNQPTVWGAQGMLYYNWQFDWMNKRVYVQPRKNPQVFHCNHFAALFALVEHVNGKYTISGVPGSNLYRALPQACELMAVEDTSLQELQQMFKDSTETVGFIRLLLFSPLKQGTRLRVRCDNEMREITVRSALSARMFYEVMKYFSSRQFEGKVESDENGNITLWFSSEAPIRYLANGQPVKLNEQGKVRLRLLRIVGLDSDQPTIEEFFLHLHSNLLQGKPVRLVCKDGSGREVLVEIPPLESLKDGASAQEGDPPAQPPKEGQDE